MEPTELRRIQDFIWNIADGLLKKIVGTGS